MNKMATHGLRQPAFVVDDGLQEWMCSIRRYLHQYPEVSFQEYKTCAYVHQKLAEIGIEKRETVSSTGIVATLGWDDFSTPGVGLRADMDGLPIDEETGLPFCSLHKGCMHGCGHDGHMAMLLGAAKLLSRVKLPGRIKLLFQPAEERDNGAKRMIDSGVLDNLATIFAGHIDTHFPTGTVTVDQGIICANADPFTIHIRGRSGHAARPHEATDAIVAASSLVTIIQTLVSREVNPAHSAVVTIGSFKSGTIHNIIAGKAVLQGTIRSTDLLTREKIIDGLRRIVESIRSMYDVETDLEFEQGLPAVKNTQEPTIVARETAMELLDVHNVISQGHPSMGGEDFSFYQQKIGGCMVRFGAQLDDETGPAHSSTFDFDENVFRVGASWLATVAYNWLLYKNKTLEEL